jgi:hypothetical protein
MLSSKDLSEQDKHINDLERGAAHPKEGRDMRLLLKGGAAMAGR